MPDQASIGHPKGVDPIGLGRRVEDPVTDRAEGDLETRWSAEPPEQLAAGPIERVELAGRLARALQRVQQDDVPGDRRNAELGAVHLVRPRLVRSIERHRVEDAVMRRDVGGVCADGERVAQIGRGRPRPPFDAGLEIEAMGSWSVPVM